MGFLAVTAVALAIPAIEDAKGGSDYFKFKLHEIQGAIDDTIKAGMDLEDMEGSLQNIVNLSSYFFRTESATEYAVDKDAYENSWAENDDSDDDKLANELWGKIFGTSTCSELNAI